jgi:hypothetical protein
LSVHEIRILQAEVEESNKEGDKIKALGEYDIEIAPKGAVPVQRKLRVVSES